MSMLRICILGANGFIGSHLSEIILSQTDWQIDAMDLASDKLEKCINHSRFHFKQGDMTREMNWVEERIKQCDVLLPLVAIATPATYVNNPLRVFELDFEANLALVRLCVTHQKRVIFPSTSEVYGMSPDAHFDEEESALVTGPIHKERWIYSSSKQLLDRLIYAYGKHHGLPYTLFRPFNWYGPRLDNPLNPNAGGSRALTQFIGNILRGEPIQLVDGGKQSRSFTFIEDGINALLRIIENKSDCAANRIFNIGNPDGHVSIRELAEMLRRMIVADYPKYADRAAKTQLVSVEAKHYFGEGYQDVPKRVPSIRRAKEQLAWSPQVDLVTGLKKTLDFYLT
jgi:nucleoside-diphosphate-sugar epimerase